MCLFTVQALDDNVNDFIIEFIKILKKSFQIRRGIQIKSTDKCNFFRICMKKSQYQGEQFLKLKSKLHFLNLEFRKSDSQF